MTGQDLRTRWAEKQAEEILSVPFISEFVFRSPQMLDGTQREIADLLILFKGTGILASAKSAGRSSQPRRSDKSALDFESSEKWREAAPWCATTFHETYPSVAIPWCW